MALSLTSRLLALNPFASIVTITAIAGSLYAAGFLPTLVGGLYGSGGSATASVATVLSGAVTVSGRYFARRAGLTSVHEVYAGFRGPGHVRGALATDERTRRNGQSPRT